MPNGSNVIVRVVYAFNIIFCFDLIFRMSFLAKAKGVLNTFSVS